jgi:hypothetical protein
VVEATPVSALTNGRAPNDPREVRRRKREAERLQKAELAAAAAPAAEVVEVAAVTEEAVVESVIAEAPRSVQDAVEHHQAAEEKNTSLNRSSDSEADKKPRRVKTWRGFFPFRRSRSQPSAAPT